MKGSRQKAGNYRPVSLTSVVGKMLESIIKEEITEHLNKNGSIKQTQHGLMKGKSCLTNLLDFYEDVTSAVDRGEPVDVVFLDFQKAFDKVPHKRLLQKIGVHGVRVLGGSSGIPCLRKVRGGVSADALGAFHLILNAKIGYQAQEDQGVHCVASAPGSELKSVAQVKEALPRPAEGKLHDLRPGEWVVIKDFRRKSWKARRWLGPFQVLLVTQTAVKVAERATWVHASHCKRVPEPQQAPDEAT
ncbi:uncharacterized protein LOC144503028 [Mustelus asterias]